MRYRTPYLMMAVLIAGTLTAAGCAKKTGVQLSEKTTTSMQNVQQSMQQAAAQIDATNASLTEVIRAGQGAAQPADIKKAYAAYSDNVKKMEKSVTTVNNHINQMTSRGNAYFEEWSKIGGTYTNPQVQKLSVQERMRLSRTFSDVAATSTGLRGTLNAYLSDVKQIQTYLSNDLTAQGIATIAPIAQAAERDGVELKRSFQPVQTAIERARLEMTPGGAAAGGVPNPQQNQVQPQAPAPQSQIPSEPQQNQQL